MKILNKFLTVLLIAIIFVSCDTRDKAAHAENEKDAETQIKEADVKVGYQFAVKENTEELNDIIEKICKSEKVNIKELKAGSRGKEASRARALISIGLVKNYGVSLAEVARRLNISTSAVSKIIRRSNR